MKILLKYLVILMVLVCYLQAAFEINAGSVKNTWGDEYDTYVHADNHHHFEKTKNEQVLIAAVPEPFQIHERILTYESLVSPNMENHSPPPKFFIDYCRLII